MSKDISQATTHPEIVRPSSAVSRWGMDDSDVSNGKILDSWSSNDGTINGATTGASGVGGSEAFSFDGTDDGINIPQEALIGGSNPRTISAWIKPGDITNRGAIFAYGDLSTSKLWSIEMSVWTDGDISLLTWDNNYNTGEQVITSNSEWYHIAVSYDGGSSQKSYRFFVNGVEFTATLQAGLFTSADTNTNDGSIGYRRPNSDRHFNGSIDEFRLYSTDLTQQQIRKLYNIGRNANWGYTRS